MARSPDKPRDADTARSPAGPSLPGLGKQTLVQQIQAPATQHASSPAVQRKDDTRLLEQQARLKGSDVEIPVLEGALLATRMEAVRLGLLSQTSFDAAFLLSQTMTQLHPAVAASGDIDPVTRERAALAAQLLFSSLQRETGDEKNFKSVSSMMPATGGITSQNPYTEERRAITIAPLWTRTHELGSWLQKLPDLIRQAEWEDAFRCYRRLFDGLDRWVADQLRKKGKGSPEEALGNAHQHYAQLRTGLEQIADKHATRLPALFHPDRKTVEQEKAAGRTASDTVPMNVYFWRDASDGKFRIYDLTTPSRPHEQTIDGPPTAAAMNAFFEEVARYPEGEVRYTLLGGGAGMATTSGKIKWYEWVGYAGLALATAGLALLTAGASIPATACFAAGAIAGGISAGGHLADTVRLGIATTSTIVLDVAQLVASFASLGAMSIAVRAGSAAAAIGSSRWFVPLVGTAAGADVVQLVALSDITYTELTKIQNSPGSPEDKQRAMAVLLTQLIVVGGLTALSVRGARDVHVLAGKPLEVVEQNGANVLRVVGDETAPSAAAKSPEQPVPTADPEIWYAHLKNSLSPEEQAKLGKMRADKTSQQVRDIFADDLDNARERVRTAVRLDRERAQIAAESKERVAELRKHIAERGLMSEPDIVEIISGTTSKNRRDRIAMLRDGLISKILRAEAAQAHPGAEVLTGIKLYEKLPEANLDEWGANHRGDKKDGLTERNDGLYVQRGEIDIMIIERQSEGKATIVSREEVKTGTLDSHSDARDQITAQTKLLHEAATSRTTIRLEVAGRDITSELDIASDATAKKTTRGPAGKGFNKSLGVTGSNLEALVKELLGDELSRRLGVPL